MEERKTMHRWYWVWDFEKEEQWLNEMAAEGWSLVDVGYCTYTFEKTEPNMYCIRLEMRKADDDYISFMEDTGAEYIGRVLQWLYFRKKSEFGQFDLFSDIDSKITHLQGIYRMVMTLGMLNLVIGTLNAMIEGNGLIRTMNLLVATLLMYGAGRLKGKIEYLEKERQIHE